MAKESSKSQLKSLEGILVQMGIISEDDAKAVRRQAGDTDGDVASAVVAERLAAELPLAEAICTHLSLPFMHADQYNVDPEVARSVPTELQKTYHFAVIDRFEGIIVIATAGVLSDEVVSNIEALTECQVQVCITTVTEMRSILENLETAAPKKTKSKAAPAASAPADAQADAQSEAALQEVLGGAEGQGDAFLDPHVVKTESTATEEPPPAMTEDEKESLLEDDEISQEADELFADLQRDLERFTPEGDDKKAEES